MARVVRPHRVEIRTKGSVGPILELGIGFQGDPTVKQNAAIYGILMGPSRSEIRKRINSIVDFAGLRRFQNAKLKYLSSGMQVRLGFSIVIQTDADVLLIDEALAWETWNSCRDASKNFANSRNRGSRLSWFHTP